MEKTLQTTEIGNRTLHAHITPERKWFEFNLKEVWRYRDLILLFTKRDFQVRYKQTILGPLWLLLTPLITSMTYVLVFGNILGVNTEGVPQIAFYLTGNALWLYFSSCISQNASVFVKYAGIFGKVYFPRLSIPISIMLSNLVIFAIQFGFSLIFTIYYSIKGMINPDFKLIPFIPIILLLIGMLGMGIGIVISSMTVKYRDLAIVVGFGISLLMYATPIVYPLSSVKNTALKTALLLNPATPLVELFRKAVLGFGTVSTWHIVYSAVASVLIWIFGVMIFNRVEKTFMDMV